MRIVALMAAGLVACADDTKTDTGTTPTGTDTGTEAVAAFSLASDVLPIFQQNCSGCHTRTDPPYTQAVANMAYLEETGDILALIGLAIVPGDSAGSALIGILNQDFGVGKGYASLMPPAPAPPVGDADIAIVAQWIDEGAEDN
jgi:mono/diheme cytochrome c family protein